MKRTTLFTSVIVLAMASAVTVGGGEVAAAPTAGNPLNPGDLTVLDGWVYFHAETPDTGVELFRSDGSGIELVADIVPGPDSSEPNGLEMWQGAIYFAATTPESGTELWRTDGTTTELFADLVPGPDSGYAPDLLATDDWLIIASGLGITRTDGTTFETAPNEVAGVGSVGYCGELVESDGWIFFVGCSPIDFRLFRTDFTTTEMAPVVSTDPENGEWPRHLAVLDGWVYYSADDWGSHDLGGRELWRSNGVTTELVADLFPEWGQASDPGGLTTIGDWIYFGAHNLDGSAVWRTNGTTTERIAGVSGGGSGFEALGDTILFAGHDQPSAAEADVELWATNGVDAAWLVDDINPGPASSEPADLTVMDGWVYFAARNGGDYRKTLWRNNGSVTEQVGTAVVFDGSVDADQVTAPRWVQTVFTPSVSGAHTFQLDWFYIADLRIAVREAATGTWVADNTGSDQPKLIETDLTAGVGYQIAVWAISGDTTFTVTVTERTTAPPPPTGDEIFAGSVDADRVTAPRWVQTVHTPSMTGTHTYRLDWAGGADLRIAVREADTGTWVADNTSSDHPKMVETDLTAGVGYQIAVWAVSGAADFTVTVAGPDSPPPPSGEEIFAGLVDADRVLAPKWVATTYTPTTSGDHEFVLDWDGDGNLRTSIRVADTGATVTQDISNDRPKTLTADLTAGVDYQIAVWAYTGTGQFTLTVTPPTG